MKTTVTLLAALGLTVSAAAPAFSAAHEVDITTLTCAEVQAMDEEGQMKVAEAAAADEAIDMDAEAAMEEMMENCAAEGATDSTVQDVLIGDDGA